MADQSQTATNKQTEPARCKQGCGFFGNAATGGFCSKCWRDVQKTKSAVASAVVPPPSPEICTNVVEKPAPLAVKVKAPGNVESSTTTPKASATNVPETAVAETPAVTESAPVAKAPAKKKKKKKTSYKNMMANMMKETAREDKDSAKDDAIRKVTGGGVFSKIDKI